VVNAVKEGAKVAFAGRRFMEDVGWSFHVMIEERVQAAADNCLSEVRKIVRDHDGDELTDSIPKLVRANPFGPVNNMIGPEGERWAPVHGLFPHSTATGVLDKIEELFARFADDIDKHEVGTGYLLATVSTNCMVIEPVFFWPDELQEVHRRHVEKNHLAGITEFQGNEEARKFVAKLRKLLIDLLQAEGGVHMQLGKAYPFQENLRPENKRILIALKKEIDPMNRMNPGALGLI
jgi:FAD/FMN-containing dehydrogenase